LLFSLVFGHLGFYGTVKATPSDPRPTKEKTFYLHTLNETRNVGPIATQHIMDSTVGVSSDSITSNMRIIARWFLFPELAGALKLEGNVNLTLWYNATGTRDGALWTLTLNELDKDGDVNLIQQAQLDLSSDPSVPTETSITASVNHTLQVGSTLEAHINIRGNAATDYAIAWGNPIYNSRIVLPARDYIRIVPTSEGGIWTLNSELQAQSNFALDAENKTIYLRAKVTDPFGGYDIRQVNITVVMPNGTVISELNNVSASKKAGYFNGFESMFQVTWNYSGYPEGRYNITIYALDNNGYLTFLKTGSYGVHLELDDSGVFFIGAPPLEVHIRVFDGDGAPLEGASVLIILGEDLQASGITNSSGYLKVDLNPGNYLVEVWWKQALVGSEELIADQSWPIESPFTMTASVFQVAFRALDAKGVSLEGAALTIRFPSGQATDEPLIADDQGIVSLGKAPGGAYSVAVMWRGKIVADTTVSVSASGTNDVNCLVFYVDFQAVDADGEPVENALVTVSDPLFGTVAEARLTNASGWLVSRLPTGSYEISAKWFGVSVLDGQSLVVDANKDVLLTLSIYTIRLVPVDSRGVVLEDATVAVSSGVFSQSGNTLDAGGVDLKLPYGDYLAKVRWQNIEVYSDTLTLDGTQTDITLNTKVFYLTVQVFDSSRSPLENVFVTVDRDGTVMGAAITDEVGETEFRLPIGTYDVEASFKTTYHLTYYEDTETAIVTLDKDKTTTITFTSFPIPFYVTILFYIIMALVAAITSFALVFFLKHRRMIK
jgi:hypothetical protein